MEIYSKNLTLHIISELELTTNYINWLNDKEVCKYNSHGEQIYTKDMAKNYITSVINNPTCEVWAVYHKKDNVHIGNISLQNIDKINNSAEIAFLFGEKKYWGNGYATEACKLLINRAFKDLKLHRLYFGTHINNLAMQKIGEKTGFQKEGIFKDAQFKNGKYNDVVRYGLINKKG